MLLRESMGLASDGTNKAFPSADVDYLLDGPPATITVDIMGRFEDSHCFCAGKCWPADPLKPTRRGQVFALQHKSLLFGRGSFGWWCICLFRRVYGSATFWHTCGAPFFRPIPQTLPLPHFPEHNRGGHKRVRRLA